ncbi:MAG TPA: hypothetical protein VF271_09795 [Rhodanobacteraceae bacterium]
MNTTQRAQLVAEKGFLEAQLASLSAGALLTRGSMESRLRQVEESLNSLPGLGFEPARAYLTFKGKPVSGTHGVAAEFGSKAVNAFVDAVAAVAASCQTTLRNMGPIPHRGENQLLITDIARGSFGFELEERGNGQLPLMDESPVKTALERTRVLLQNSAEGNDEGLADAADGLDRRALKSLHKFVSTLVEDDALCALQLGDELFRFADMGQVRHSFERLSDDNVHEEKRTLSGRFNGMIPVRRTFEFQAANGEVLVGRAGDAVTTPDSINDHLHEKVEAKFQVTRIGQGRPRYVLLELPQWDREESDELNTPPESSSD